MKVIVNLIVLVALIGGVTFACVSSTAPKTTAAAFNAELPTAGCVKQASRPDVVEQCGQCTIIGLPGPGARDSLAHHIAAASSQPVWFAVGSTWLGGDDGTTLGGAVYCADRYGGTVSRFTS